MDGLPYLVQRMKLRDKVREDLPPGVDVMYSMDYMGAAEFEFGALPKSLRRITSVVDKFEVTKVEKVAAKDGRRLYLLCHRHATAELLKVSVPLLLSGKARLKEATNLEESLNSPERTYHCCDAWWDIDHDFFLILGEKNAAKTLEALKALRDRWAQEKK